MDRGSDEGEIKPAAGASSAEERCPICLEDYEDKAFIDACFHAFCFGCIVKAVEMTTGRCPMCKASFDTVIHNVRAIDDYDRVKVQPKPTPTLSITDEEAFRVFRGYRTTRLPGQPPRVREPNASTSFSHDHTATVMTSGSTSSLGSLATTSSRTHTRKQRSKFGRQSRKPAALERRRAVYSTGLRAMPIESTDTKRVRVRDISACFFHSNPASTHRLFPWLTREFKVLVGDEHVEFMLQLIQSLIDKIDMENEDFGGHLEPFLHEKTEHFMHELISFAKSPYDMIAYDNKVRYNWPEDHPQAQEQTRGDEGLSVSDASSQPGPSGIQQRILEELMLTRMDSSPPLRSSQSGSHSPTIFISDSSDSEADTGPECNQIPSPPIGVTLEEPTTLDRRLQTAQTPSTASTSSSSTQVHAQNFKGTTAEQREQPINMTTSSSTTLMTSSVSSAMPSIKGQERTILELEDASGEQLGRSDSVESCPVVSSSASFREKNDSINLNEEVSSTSGIASHSETVPPPLGSLTTESQPNTEVLSCEPHSRDQVQEAGEDGGDFEISVYAEDGGASLGGDGTPTSDTGRGGPVKDVHGKSTRVDKLKKKKEESRRRSSERDKQRKRHHKHSHQRSRSRSRSRSKTYRSHRHRSPSESRYHRRESSHKERKSSHRFRSSSRSSSYHNSSDDETPKRKRKSKDKIERIRRKQDEDRKERRERADYKGRRQERVRSRSLRPALSKHHHDSHDYDHRKSPSRYERRHRSRLYSEESWSKHSQFSHVSEKHSTSNIHDMQKRKTKRKRREQTSVERTDESDEEMQKSEMTGKTKKLTEELSEVDRQIQDNKKELLKSMLRKERLELLQRNLHGEGSLTSGGVLSAAVGCVLEDKHDVAKKTTGEMERELELLNRAIVDGKKRLLRVMKKVEEDQLDDD